MKREEILKAAEACICGHRQEEYGTPENNFETIGDLWTTYINRKWFGNEERKVLLTAGDVGIMMCLFKIARLMGNTATTDSFVDLAGYAPAPVRLKRSNGMEGKRLKIKEYICRKCGQTFLAKRVKKVCPHCGAKWQNELKAEYARRQKEKRQKMSKLDYMLEEIDEYNRRNGTSLSYGQYVSKMQK